MPSNRRSISALVLSIILVAAPAFAFDHPLSDEAVREAYFLGQRRDESTANFLNKYTRHLAPPESGPYVSYVSFFTPYANAVQLSSRNSLGSSAQDALQEYKKRGSIVRAVITLEFTANYGAVLESPTGTKSNSPKGFQYRSSQFWRDFSYRLFQKDQAIPPANVEGEATYSSSPDGGSSILTGATVTLYFDIDSIEPSTDADVVVDTIDNQQAVATFTLATLR